MSAVTNTELAAAQAVADRYVVAELQSECKETAVPDSQFLWLDTYARFSEYEHTPRVIDWHRESLDYALHRGLVVQHPTRAHLVRVTHRKEAHA